MATWQDVIDAEPAFAAEIQAVLDAHKHKLIATLRPNGSPRISGLECEFAVGQLHFGMMPRSRKAADLRRDPRLEIHSSSEDAAEDDPSTWLGDAKISGRAIEVTDPQERAAFTEDPGATHPMFVVDIERVVRIKLDGSPLHLLVRTWRPGSKLKDVFAD